MIESSTKVRTTENQAESESLPTVPIVDIFDATEIDHLNQWLTARTAEVGRDPIDRLSAELFLLPARNPERARDLIFGLAVSDAPVTRALAAHGLGPLALELLVAEKSGQALPRFLNVWQRLLADPEAGVWENAHAGLWRVIESGRLPTSVVTGLLPLTQLSPDGPPA